MESTKPSLLMKAEEVAYELSTSRKVVYELARLGKIPGVVRLGRALRFRRDRLLQFIRQGEVVVSSLGETE